jgi:demethylmenaquinone methyltransferase/2-methoxy-6-polyprenyl-1,4-benzoquinol methylase
MFDRIAHRYDLLNHLLSAGRDPVWRDRLARRLAAGAPETVVDLATGTGDQLLALLGRCPTIRRGLGLDVSLGMLQHGRPKLAASTAAGRLALIHGDALALPLRSGSTDAVTITFGIRNVADVAAALVEMSRVLRPGGRVLILEFGLPSVWLLRRLYLLYFRYVLPLLGGLISGDSDAYRYLNRTVESFPYGEQFCALLRGAGFTQVAAQPLTFGVVYLYEGVRP